MKDRVGLARRAYGVSHYQIDLVARNHALGIGAGMGIILLVPRLPMGGVGDDSHRRPMWLSGVANSACYRFYPMHLRKGFPKLALPPCTTGVAAALEAGTQTSLEALQTRVENGRLRRMEKIAEALGRLKARSKVTKHFEYFVEEGQFTFERKEESILLEPSLDGIYVIRTSVSQERLSAEEAVKGYNSQSRVERAFRTFKSMDLKTRPIHHWVSDRVGANIFICMLAYYVEWHLREAWREFLFDDEEPGSRATESPVNPAVRSPGALAKANKRHARGEEPVHSWRTLLASLGTIGRHIVRIPAKPNAPSFQTVTAATPFQQTLCERVGCNLVSGRRQKQLP